MEEIWKDIYFWRDCVKYDYRGLYQVSNYGRIKSLKYKRSKKEKILKICINNKTGYSIVNLQQKTFHVHTLVAHMFLADTYFNGAEVDHIDTNRMNNHVNNLRWCTRKENCNNELTKKHYSEKTFSEEYKTKISEAVKETWKNKPEKEKAEIKKKQSEKAKKRFENKENHPMFGKTGKKAPHLGELIAKIDKNILEILDIKYNFEYVKDDNFNHSDIYKCCKGIQKTHRGFIFKYLSDVPDDVINSYIIRTKQIPITN